MFSRIISYGGIKILAMLASVIYVVYLGKLLNPEDLGLYYMTMAVLAFFSILARMGFDGFVVKEFPIHSYNNDKQVISNLLRTITFRISTVSIVLIVIAALLFPILNELLFNSKAKLSNFLIILTSLTFYSLSFIYSEVFKSIDRYRLSIVFPTLVLPLVSLVVVYFTYFELGETSLYVAVAVSSGICFIFSYIIIRNHCKDKVHIKKIDIGFQKDFFIISMSNYIFAYCDTIFLGLLSSNSDVGVFNILTRITLPLSALLIVINSVSARQFSIYQSSSKIEMSKKLYKKLVFFSLFVGSLYLLFIILFGQEILNYFGESYVYGYIPLVLICIGNFILLITGPSAVILMVSGQEKDYKNVLVYTGIFGLLISPILILNFGLTGAAVASCLVLSIKNLFSFKLVRNYFRSQI